MKSSAKWWPELVGLYRIFWVRQDRQWWDGEGEWCHDLTTATAQQQIESRDLGTRVLLPPCCQLWGADGGDWWRCHGRSGK